MSQEKVDRYKQEKANRKKNMKKEKFGNVIRKCAVVLVGIALVGWIGYSAYTTYDAKQPQQEAQVDYTAVNELSQNLAAVQVEEPVQ